MSIEKFLKLSLLVLGFSKVAFAMELTDDFYQLPNKQLTRLARLMNGQNFKKNKNSNELSKIFRRKKFERALIILQTIKNKNKKLIF